MNHIPDPLGLAGDTLNASRSPYIAVVINSTAFSIPHEFVKEGLTGAQKLMRSLKEEARKTYGGPHPNRNHHHQIAVHVEIIADTETWKALFTNSVDFIDGCNGDNTCRISYHADFTKVAEGERTIVHIGIWSLTVVRTASNPAAGPKLQDRLPRFGKQLLCSTNGRTAAEHT